MKKILSLVLIFAFCGLNFVFATGQSEAGSSDGPVTLSYMTWDYADRTASTDAWIAQMEEDHGIIIDLMNVPTDQYEATLKTRLVSNDLPDLFKVHSIKRDYTLYGTEVDPSMLYDLSDLSVIDEYVGSIIDGVRLSGGELAYVPLTTNALGVIYNKDVFAANGLDVPGNYDELTAVCEALKGAGVIPFAAGFRDAWTTQILPFIAFAYFVNADDMEIRKKLADGTMKYADIEDKMRKVLEIQQDFNELGYFQQDALGTDVNIASTLVGTGKAAMLIMGTWQYQAVQDADPAADIGFFALPLNEPRESVVIPTSADEGIVINALGDNLDAAKQAMEVFLGSENQALVASELNGISTNQNVSIDSAFVNEVTAAMGDALVQPEWWGQKGYYHPTTTTFNKPNQLNALFAGILSVDEFIAEFDRLNQKALEE
jgi:raffinose/stachyose/melibiose transport system substrate-binding protein